MESKSDSHHDGRLITIRNQPHHPITIGDQPITMGGPIVEPITMGGPIVEVGVAITKDYNEPLTIATNPLKAFQDEVEVAITEDYNEPPPIKTNPLKAFESEVEVAITKDYNEPPPIKTNPLQGFAKSMKITVRVQMTLFMIAMLRSLLTCWSYAGLVLEAEPSLLPLLFGLTGGTRLLGVFLVGVANVWESVLVALALAGYVVALVWKSISSAETSVPELLIVSVFGGLAEIQPWMQRRMVHIAGDDSSKLTTMSRVTNMGCQTGYIAGSTGVALLYNAWGYTIVLTVVTASATLLMVLLLIDRSTLKTVGPEPTSSKERPFVWIDHLNKWFLCITIVADIMLWSNIPKYLSMACGADLKVGSYIISASCVLAAVVAAILESFPLPSWTWLERPYNQTALLLTQSLLFLMPTFVPTESKIFFYVWSLILLIVNAGAIYVSVEMIVGVGDGCSRSIRDAGIVCSIGAAMGGACGAAMLEVSVELPNQVVGALMLVSGSGSLLAYKIRRRQCKAGSKEQFAELLRLWLLWNKPSFTRIRCLKSRASDTALPLLVADTALPPSTPGGRRRRSFVAREVEYRRLTRTLPKQIEMGYKTLHMKICLAVWYSKCN